MTAIKKTKTAKSPAPATKPAKSPAKSKAKVAAVSKASVATVPPVAPIPGGAVPPVAVKANGSTRAATKIVARVDVGFGNALYIRGEGPGLSWNEGVPMQCVANDEWQFTVGESPRPVTFKLLVNDRVWCTGQDFSVVTGSQATITPEFA
jgi:hypothetical protein